MKLRELVVAVGMTCLVGAAGSASATVLTFDDMSATNYALIPVSYGGIENWTNLGVLDGSMYPGSYANSVVSPSNVTFPWGGQRVTISNPANFFLNSAYFTAIWTPVIDLVFTGYDNGGAVNSMQVSVGQTPTLIGFNWDIDALTIDTYYTGTQSRTWFGMDNFAFNEANVPEPSSIALLGLGLAGLALRRMKKA